MKPIIGITTDIDAELQQVLGEDYVRAIIRAGGMPVIVPTGVDEDVKQLASVLDGLLLSGGEDVDPVLFDEEPHASLGKVTPERDSVELLLARQMVNADKPVLGICRGMQLLNILFGGSLYQDLRAQHEEELIQHRQSTRRWHASHTVILEKGSKLASVVRKERIRVNSFHHQSLKDIARPLVATGRASDGIIEAVESDRHRFVVGIQWHPEALARKDDPVSLRLFEQFIRECMGK